MAEKGSFWSSLPGVLTGIAGLATAVVGLLSLAASQGWIGGDGGGDAGEGDAAPVVDVEPRAIEFQPVPTSREATVAVTNEGTGPFRVDQPQITGPDADRFDVDGSACTRKELPAGQSCDVVVTFDPGGPGRSSARLVVSVNDAAQSVQVPIEATAVLG
jgi:hypothetical protein